MMARKKPIEARDFDYPVGKYKPPVRTQFQRGQSGNPMGRPRGRRNVKTEMRQVLSTKVPVRIGEKDYRLSLAPANLLVHGLKGAEGDARSSSHFFNALRGLGILDQLEDDERDGVLLPAPGDRRPGSVLIETIDLDRLSRDEQFEVSQYAKVIDLGGDFTALSIKDFDSLKRLVNKARGKDITPLQ